MSRWMVSEVPYDLGSTLLFVPCQPIWSLQNCHPVVTLKVAGQWFNLAFEVNWNNCGDCRSSGLVPFTWLVYQLIMMATSLLCVIGSVGLLCLSWLLDVTWQRKDRCLSLILLLCISSAGTSVSAFDKWLFPSHSPWPANELYRFWSSINDFDDREIGNQGFLLMTIVLLQD